MLGQRLKALMDQRGITAAELARRVGVKPPTISFLLSGTTSVEKVRAATIEALARELGTTWVYLMHGKGPANIDVPETKLNELVEKYLSLTNGTRNVIDTTLDSFVSLVSEERGRYR
jgi:transcriptional regulator with XRE-family HTH domain